MALAAFKAFTAHRLVVLLLQFLLGNSFLLLAADPASPGWTDLYLTVALLTSSLLLTTVAAASILLYVGMALSFSSTEAKAAAARPKLPLVAITLSLASTILAILTFHFGTGYRTGRTSVVFGWPAWVIASIMGLEHGFCGGLLLVLADLCVPSLLQWLGSGQVANRRRPT